MQKVSIVIVNWNTGELLKKCIASIMALSEIEMIRHVVVVDNNSSDGSHRDLPLTPSLSQNRRGERTTLTTLAQDKNLGFAKANNLGIHYIHAHHGDEDHVLLLNPDTEVTPSAIKNMLAVLTRNSRAGIVGSTLLHTDGTIQKSVRTFPTFKVLAMLFLKMQRVFPHAGFWQIYMMSDFNYSREQSVDQVMGASFLIRNTVIRNIGLLDEKFWIWFEEVDYCKRAISNGWEVVYAPSAEIMHHGGVSFGQVLYGPKKTIPILNSGLLYAKKHMSIRAQIVLTALYPAGILVSVFAILARKQPVNPLVAWAIIAMISAIFIGFFISMQLAVGALALVCVVWWVYENAEEGLLLLIILSPLLPLLKVTQTLGNATLIKDVIIFSLFFKTFLMPLFKKTLPYRKNVLLAPIIALSGWSILQTLHASSHVLAVLRLRDILLYIILYFAVLYLPHTKKIMRARFAWFIGTLIVVMTLGVIQLKSFPDSTVLRFDPARSIWIPRIGSTFGHPTPFAEFLITAQMLCLGYLLAGYKNNRDKIIVTAIFIATLPLLYFTYTRAGWIAFVIGVAMIGIVYIWSKKRSPLPNWGEGAMPSHRQAGEGWSGALASHLPPSSPSPQLGGRNSRSRLSNNYLIGFILLLSFTFATLRFTHVGTFMRSAFDPAYASNAERFEFITQLISRTSNSDAIIGKGLGSSITQTAKPSDVTAGDITGGETRTIQLSKDATLVDNQYLKTFIEMGIVGVVFTLWLFWRFVALSLACFSPSYEGEHEGVRERRLLGLAGIGFITTFAVQALFVDIWDIYPTNAIFWVLAALISQEQIPK